MITVINQRGLRTARLSSDNVAAQAQTSGVLANSARRHSLLAQRSATVRTLSPRTTTAVCFKVVLTSASRWGLSELPVIWQKKGKKNKNPKGRAADVTRFAPQQRPPAHCKSPPHGAGQSVRQSGNNSTRHRKRPKCVASLRPDLFEAWKRAARFL